MPEDEDESFEATEFRRGRRPKKRIHSPASPADRAKVQAAALVLATKIFALCIDKAGQLSVPTIVDVNSALLAETLEAVRKRF